MVGTPCNEAPAVDPCDIPAVEKKNKDEFYAVAIGIKTGIFASWAECEAQVKEVSGALFKKFNSKADAEKCSVERGNKTGKLHYF